MKFKLKKNIVDLSSETALEDYLGSLGIVETQSFTMAPVPWDEESPDLLSRIDDAAAMLYKHVTSPNPSVYLQVDSDCDGYTSAAIIYNFITEVYPHVDIQFGIHPEKEHGIFPKDVDYTRNLVIVPDAGSSQLEETQELSQRADILIIDHHIADVDINTDKVIVVNNQTSPSFNNKNLSGAGMVYKFVKHYVTKYDIDFDARTYLDLAAVGIIADAMDSRNIDNNYIIYHGLNNIKNPMLKVLLEKRAYSVSSVEKPNKIDIAFYIAPIINGLIRFGKREEKEDFFYALATSGIEETYERTWRGKTTTETYYEKVAREAVSVKTSQDGAIKKLVPQLTSLIEKDKLNENQLLIVPIPSSIKIPNTVTGLVAMKLCAIYNKPTMLVRKSMSNGVEVYRGSLRSVAVDGFESFKDYLDSSGLATGHGHDNAAGVVLPVENYEALLEVSNVDLANVDIGDTTIEADAHIKSIGHATVIGLRRFAKAAHVYGNQIPEPVFVFDLDVSANDVTAIGKSKDTLRISSAGITFIKFRASKEIEMLEQNMSGHARIRVVGTAAINSFQGYENLQVKINAIDFLGEEVSRF